MSRDEKVLLEAMRTELAHIKSSQELIFKELVGDPTMHRDGLIVRQKRDEEFQATVTDQLKDISHKQTKLFEKHDTHDLRLKSLESKLSIFDALGTIRKSTAWLILGGITFLTTILGFWDSIKALFHR